MQQIAPNRGPRQARDHTHLIGLFRQTIAMLSHAKEVVNIFSGDFDGLGLFLDDLGQGFARHLGNLTLKVPHARLASVIADDRRQRIICQLELGLLQAVVLDLFGDKVLLGNLTLFILRIARQRNDLHPVEQRPGHVVAVRGGQEHHVGEVIFDLQIVIDKGAVLFRVQHFQHRRRGVAPEILTHLVDLIEQDQRVRRLGFFQRLNDLAGHRPDIGPAVAPNFAFVTHTTQRDANKFTSSGLGDRFPKRGFAHAGRADQTHDRAFHFFAALLHGQIFDDAFLDLFKTIVVVVQDTLGPAQIFLDPRFHAPRDRQHPVEVVANNRCLGAHRRHVLELFQLGVRLFARFLGQLGLGDLAFQLGHLVLAVLAIAQLVLNGLHLLIQIILALGLLHLGFDAGLDLFLDLQDGHFALHQAVHLFQTLAHRQRLKQILLLVDFNAQMPGHEVGQFRRLGGFPNGGQRLFWDVLLDLGVALKFVANRSQQRLGRGHIARHLGQVLCARFKEGVVFKVFRDAHPRLPLHQHLDGAIGQFQQLQHIGQHPGLVNAACVRIVL
mmetsp:Transcript_29204/g.56461  ORF Transcript_29204/g.56461 Transcript_29204/m.56461 type:complete len:553 (-) Transcript_29204:1689-3347(-)